MIRTLAWFGVVIGLTGIAVGGRALLLSAEGRRKQIVKIGADLARPQGFLALYRHDQAAVRLLERILQQDRAIPILSDVDRDEAGRLIKAFYDDKGD